MAAPNICRKCDGPEGPTQSTILWPEHFLPGTTDNFVSNEVIVKGLTAREIWDLLADISKSESYYKNVSQIAAPESCPILEKGDVFKFSKFGFPVLTCPVEESVPPPPHIPVPTARPCRIAWSARLDAPNPKDSVEVYHAWLIEDLEGGRVRILTQKSQIGKSAAQLAGVKPNKMLLGHQDWLDGLVAAARGQKIGQPNLDAIEGCETLLAFWNSYPFGQFTRSIPERQYQYLVTFFSPNSINCSCFKGWYCAISRRNGKSVASEEDKL